MKIKIRDFRAVERADLEIGEGITIVAGDLGVGKTSILSGIGAILSGNPVAWPNVLKKDLDILVRTGAETARIRAADGPEGEGWESAIEYPSGQLMTTGAGKPTISASAAGNDSYLDLPLKNRALFLADYLSAEPSKLEFEEAGSDLLLDKKILDAVWAKIEKDGWDNAFTAVAAKTPQLKGRWLEITGETWGGAKSPKWRPQHWADDLEQADPDALAAAVSEAQESYEAAVARAAIAGSEHMAMQERAKDLPALDAKLDEMRETVAAQQAKVDEASAALDALPLASIGILLESTCPHCNETVACRVEEKKNELGNVYERRITLTEAAPKETKEERKTRQAAEHKVETATAKLADLTGDINGLETAIEAARSAQDATAEIKARQDVAGDADGALSITEADVILQDARNALAAHQSFARAQGVHRLITVNTRVRGNLLAEDGLRATVLSRELDAFNKDVLKPLALASGFSPVTGEAVGGQGWPDVTIEKNFDVRWGLYRYDLASTSQQWRARAIIQIALAQIKKDVVVVLDEVSATLTPGTLSGLFSLLQFAGVAAVMGWKETKIKRLPPLKAKGLGRVYFVENGKCREIE